MGPHRTWLLEIGVTPYQVYCALNISKHLNLLYLEENKYHHVASVNKSNMHTLCVG